jgi:hypothetical protein
VKEMYHAWQTVRDEAAVILRNAGLPEPQHPKDAPHVMRHTRGHVDARSRKNKVSLEQTCCGSATATTTPSFRRTRRSGDDPCPESCERLREKGGELGLIVGRLT